MALLSNDEVRLRLAFETEGSAGISTLADNLDALAADAGKAAPHFQALADEIRQLDKTAATLTGLQRLEQESASLGMLLDGLKGKAAGLAPQLAAASKATDELSSAQTRAGRELKAEQSSLEEKRLALKLLAAQMRESGSASSEMVAQEIALRTDIKASVSAVKEKDAALKAANSALTAAKTEQQALTAEFQSASREISKTAAAYDRQDEAVTKLSAELKAAGVEHGNLAAATIRLADAQSRAEAEARALVAAEKASADAARVAAEQKAAAARAQAAEEDRLAAIVEAGKNRQKMAAQELLAYEKKAYAEAQAAVSRSIAQRDAEAKAVEDFSTRTKKALADAFSGTGTRSTAAIQSDILQVNQSLQKLASNAKVSGADFDRAFAAGQARIATLRAEMDGTGAASAKLEASTKTLAGEFKGLVAQLGGVYVAFQAGGMFVAANSQAETFARTMTLLTGSSEKAAAEMEYVRGAANRLGLEVQTASKSYTQLVAATKGTAMEGESARKVFEAVSGAMASLGKSSSETNDALRAVNQMASKGTVQMEELKGQLGEALPGAMKAAANGAGLTVAELTKMVETGGVLAEDLLPALANGLNEMYKTGTTNNDTFVANWARLKNAITDTFQVIGDTGLFRALVVVVEQVGIAIGGLTGAFVLLGKTFGITAGAIATFDWKHPIDSMVRWRDSVSQAADEIQKNLDKQKAAAQGAADKQKEAADAVEASGQKASAAAGNWLQIENAYTKASDTSKKYIENLKTLQAARDSEAAAMKAYADTYGTEKEKLEASSNAALEHEKALRALSEQVNADLEISKAKLASLEAERRVDGSLTEAKEKLREELEKTIVAKQAEADKTLQATSAAHSATLQAEASASVYADHAKQIYALRDAYQAAESEYQRLAAINATGVNVAKELKTADEARAKALLLYRDALSDATAAAERHAVAERTAASLQQSALQNDLYRANTILEIAKQRGNEKEIAQAQIAVWRIELEISEAQAQASRLEAEAMLIVAKAKRAELEASGALTEAKKAELAVMDANIKAKQLEAEKYDLIAARMKSLSYETKELKSGFDQLSNATDAAAASADKAAGSYEDLRGSIVAAGKASDGWSRDTNGNIVAGGPNASALAAKYSKSLEEARIFEEQFAFFYQQGLQTYTGSDRSGTAYAEQYAIENAKQEVSRQMQEQAKSSKSENSSQNSAGPTGNTFYGSVGRTININLNGKSTSIRVANQTDADALVGTLQELAARS